MHSVVVSSRTLLSSSWVSFICTWSQELKMTLPPSATKFFSRSSMVSRFMKRIFMVMPWRKSFCRDTLFPVSWRIRISSCEGGGGGGGGGGGDEGNSQLKHIHITCTLKIGCVVHRRQNRSATAGPMLAAWCLKRRIDVISEVIEDNQLLHVGIYMYMYTKNASTIHCILTKAEMLPSPLR